MLKLQFGDKYTFVTLQIQLPLGRKQTARCIVSEMKYYLNN